MSLINTPLAALAGLVLPSFFLCADDEKAPPVFDETAKASVTVDAAVEEARADAKRVLVFWGNNDSERCAEMHRLFNEDRGLARILLYEFEVTAIDVGTDEGGRNREFAKGLGATTGGELPWLTVLDAAGKPRANASSEEFETEGTAGINALELAAFLTAHRAPRVDADDRLEKALVEARRMQKRLFVHFSNPPCTECERLEAWLDRDDVSKLLAKDFLFLEIDVDRMDGGRKILTAYRKQGDDVLPWLAYLLPDGSAVGSGRFPVSVDEVDGFIQTLREVSAFLTEEDLEALKKSLVPVPPVPDESDD